MSRVVIPEEQPKMESQEQKQTNRQEKEQQVVKKVANSENGVTISSAELEHMFYEWDATGKNDLIVNGSIAGRIEEYLAYQETLKPLKVKLAEEQFERFLIDDVGNGYENTVYVNSEYVGKVKAYYKNSSYAYMEFEDFRIILCVCKNPYAYYPYKNSDKIIDVRGWVIEHGGTYKVDNDEYRIDITMPL